MSPTIEQIAEEALSLPGEARTLLADRLVESLDPLEDGYIRQLWVTEARTRRDNAGLAWLKPFRVLRRWITFGNRSHDEIRVSLNGGYTRHPKERDQPQAR